MSAKKARIVKVLVASPGDVAEERAMVEDVINQWNARPLRPLKLEPVLSLFPEQIMTRACLAPQS